MGIKQVEGSEGKMGSALIECASCKALSRISRSAAQGFLGQIAQIRCRGCGSNIQLDLTEERALVHGGNFVQPDDVSLELSERPERSSESLLPHTLEADEAPPIAPRPSVAPPRPWELETRLRASGPASPAAQDVDGLPQLAPLQPLQGVRLTQDGRLINRADEGLAVGRPVWKRRRVVVPLSAAAGMLVALGLAQAELPSFDASSVESKRAGFAPEVSSVAEVVLAQPTTEERDPSRLEAEPELELVDTELAQGRTTLTVAASSPAADDDSRTAQAVHAGSVTGESLPLASPARASRTGSSAAAETEGGASAGSGVALGGDDSPMDEMTEDEQDALPPFSKEAATAALERAQGIAAGCRAEEDPAGTATVVLTFSSSGKATTAVVSGRPYAGTATGSCLARAFRAARVPAFQGDFVTVRKTVVFQ